MIYPDLAFVLSLLAKGDRSREAAEILRDTPHPLPLSLVHRLQIENGLLRGFLSSDRQKSRLAKDGLLLWREYLNEQVFLIQHFDLEFAFAKAAEWNSAFQFQPPRWGLLLHPALALEKGATFLSFDPALRRRAADEGLDLLPQKI